MSRKNQTTSSEAEADVSDKARREKDKAARRTPKGTTGFLFCVKCGTPADEYTRRGICLRCKAIENRCR